MRNLPIIIVFCLLVSSAIAQSGLHVSGTVVDRDTNQPLAFASVAITGRAISQTPVEEKVMKDLISNVSLDDQFKKSSTQTKSKRRK